MSGRGFGKWSLLREYRPDEVSNPLELSRRGSFSIGNASCYHAYEARADYDSQYSSF